ncbi:MAG: L,D-transpeptidase, partial [Muribaculaceae bacterium]|nr:L,D-transpeptidase [Muribaculaceae bacterium]
MVNRNRHLLSLVIMCVSILFMSNCGRNNKENNAAAISVSDAASDSISVPQEEIKIEEVKRKVWFSSAKEAIEYMKESGHWENYEKGILPQMAEDELKYTNRLLNNTHDGFIVVDKARMKVIRFNQYGEEVVSFGMACARNFGTKHEKPDNRTPEGFFSVRKVHDSTDWQFVDDDGVKSEKKGEFGPRFIRLNIPGWYSIGIHGTCAPWSIGGRRSHGCIRITNENIMKLVEMVDSGLPGIG